MQLELKEFLSTHLPYAFGGTAKKSFSEEQEATRGESLRLLPPPAWGEPRAGSTTA